MPLIQIRNHKNKQIIYEGSYNTAKECLQSAIKDNVSLQYADLQYCNLGGITLDGTDMSHALFNFANLNGANMSEANFDHVQFTGATLPHGCLCESSFKGADFTAALFGATDIVDSVFDEAIFGTTSSLSLNFREARSLENCLFRSGELMMPFSKAPVTISGMDFPVTFLDSHMGIGNLYRTYAQWFDAPNDNVPQTEHDIAYKYRFLKMNHKTLLEIAKAHTKQHVFTEKREAKTNR